MPLPIQLAPLFERRWPLVRWLMQKRWRMARGLTMGGQVCVIDERGHILLVRHGYRPGWHFPGGGVETGESVGDAAIRELEEETGVIARQPLALHGIFNHSSVFPGDHIVLFVVREFKRGRTPTPGFEIAEQGFFAADELPPATNVGTRSRIDEIMRGKTISPIW